jgi:membrane-associated phospholipid phosphatase
VRLGLSLYTLAMAFTLVYGGEHFVADIVAGWAMALAVHSVVSFVAGRRARRAVDQAT